MLRLLTSLALLTTSLAAATPVPDVPAVRFDLLPGGKVNVVVGTRTYPMESAKAAELRQALEALDLPGIRADISKMRERLRAGEKAEVEAGIKAKAVERENGRVKAAEREIAELEKRRASLEEQIKRAQRAKSDSLDSLRSQLSGVNQRLAKENRDLARAKELQAKAKRAKEEADGAAKAGPAEAERLRKSAEERLEKVRAALKAAGVA